MTHKPALSLERRGGSGSGQDRLSMRLQRDVELPMSPIERTSSLDLMDTTSASTAAFLFSAGGQQGHQEVGGASGDDDNGEGKRRWRGEREELPRVSTQKIPHRTVLDSFGPPMLKVSDESRWRFFAYFND